MAKRIIFAAKAREGIKRGIDKVADAVRVTVGPKGRNVVFDKGYGAPTITNDGVTIAKEITLKDVRTKESLDSVFIINSYKLGLNLVKMTEKLSFFNFFRHYLSH